MTELTSTRTILRHFVEDDRDELLGLFRDSSVRRYLLDDSVVSVDWVTDEIVASRERFESSGSGLWSIRLKDQKPIIGFAGFREFFDPPQLQLLYGLLPAFWGQGLATEAAASICEHAFRDLGFDAVRAAIDIPNTASASVLDRLGMELKRRSPEGENGTAFYVLRRADWESRIV